MPTKVCPKGHWYDPSIYGDECPMCSSAAPSAGGHMAPPPMGGSPGTEIAGGGMPPTPGGVSPHTSISGGGGFGSAGSGVPPVSPADASGETVARPGTPPGAPDPGGTVIRRPGDKGAQQGAGGNGRRLVGFLVTYNRHPNGKAFNLYEGRNYIGRSPECGISCPDDDQMSSKHMQILYRSVDNKFKFRDEQSSNGTFVNKQLLDEGELNNYDIIRVGSTLFIFMPIPKIM